MFEFAAMLSITPFGENHRLLTSELVVLLSSGDTDSRFLHQTLPRVSLHALPKSVEGRYYNQKKGAKRRSTRF